METCKVVQAQSNEMKRRMDTLKLEMTMATKMMQEQASQMKEHIETEFKR
jgi:hypothetical protein